MNDAQGTSADLMQLRGMTRLVLWRRDYYLWFYSKTEMGCDFKQV
jgi:hypothetical protein